MSWMAKLYETYEFISSNKELNDGLEPYYHKIEPCHIEIILDRNGNFMGGKLLVKEVTYGNKKFWKGEDTLIPITPESSTGRTSGPAPYPLIDQIQYIAEDYPDYGGKKKSYFSQYSNLLNSWGNSENFSHYKVKSVAKYVAKGRVVRDLINAKILFTYNDNGKEVLITKWSKQAPFQPNSKKTVPKPPLINALNQGEQGNAKIRWRVQIPGEANDSTWQDDKLIKAWQAFQNQIKKNNGFCQILGKETFIFDKHPKGINSKTNDAKLISLPTDTSYLTYQGRFTGPTEPLSVSFEVSQKAHNMLRWLINRQGQKINEQVYVSWAVSGKVIPEPFESTWELFFNENLHCSHNDEKENNHDVDHSVDAGQSFAEKLNMHMMGYLSKLVTNDHIIVIGLDSATKGRMSVIYYRELMASEFLSRLEKWHNQFAWPQRFTVPNPESKKKDAKKTIWSVSSPPPRNIAEAAYGNILKSNEPLKKGVIERILPCIVDGRHFPHDLVLSSVRRTCNRHNCEKWEWERNLGITCALYKGFYLRHPQKNERREYKMALEEERTTRDYLYGRLLAIAEKIEETALYVGGEDRPTTAARLMQRFADRPFSTWRNIELALQPYMQRLKSNRAGFLVNKTKELDSIFEAFSPDDFTSEKPLSGEFLLGYHCQKQAWQNKSNQTKENE